MMYYLPTQTLSERRALRIILSISMKYCHTSRAPNVVDGTCFARLGGLYMKCTGVAITL